MEGADALGCVTGINVQRVSIINANATTIDASDFGVVASYGSTIAADRSTITNSNNRGALAEYSSTIDLMLATVPGPGGSADIGVGQGSFMNAHDCETSSSTDGAPHIDDANIGSFNSLSANGIIVG